MCCRCRVKTNSVIGGWRAAGLRFFSQTTPKMPTHNACCVCFQVSVDLSDEISDDSAEDPIVDNIVVDIVYEIVSDVVSDVSLTPHIEPSCSTGV